MSTIANEEESSGDGMVSSTTLTGALLKKNINRGRWTKEEDERLKQLVEQVGEKDWQRVSGYFVDRNDVQCQQRWDKVVNPKLVKGPWTKEVGGRCLCK